MTAKATVPVEASTPGQVANSRPDHGDVGLQRVGVDHRGDGVGRVVEAVDKLEAQRNQQGQCQQQIGPDAGDRDRVQILGHMEADVAEAGQQGPAERPPCPCGLKTSSICGRAAIRWPVAMRLPEAPRPSLPSRPLDSPKRPETFRGRLGLQVETQQQIILQIERR